jgi:hypothetical protein
MEIGGLPSFVGFAVELLKAGSHAADGARLQAWRVLRKQIPIISREDNMVYRMIPALAAALALTITLCSPPKAEAADRFAMISIANETNANITIVYRWGNGEKKRHSFAPGARQWFSYRYPKPDADQSPDFFISFDADTTKQNYKEDQRLHGFRTPEENYDLGHKYAFRYNGPSKKYIEIYDLSRR